MRVHIQVLSQRETIQIIHWIDMDSLTAKPKQNTSGGTSSPLVSHLWKQHLSTKSRLGVQGLNNFGPKQHKGKSSTRVPEWRHLSFTASQNTVTITISSSIFTTSGHYLDTTFQTKGIKKNLYLYIYIIHILQTPATISIFPPQFLLHFNKPSDFTAASVSLRPNLWRPKASTAPAKAAASAATGFAKSGASAANSRRCWSRHGVLSSTSTPSSKRRSVESLSWIFGSFFLFLGGKSFQFPVDSKTMPTNRYTAIRIMLAVRPQIVCPCVLS